jgi:hypothetical protein
MLRSISGISEVLQQHCGVIFRCAFILYIKQRSYFWVYRRPFCKTAGTTKNDYQIIPADAVVDNVVFLCC